MSNADAENSAPTSRIRRIPAFVVWIDSNRMTVAMLCGQRMVYHREMRPGTRWRGDMGLASKCRPCDRVSAYRDSAQKDSVYNHAARGVIDCLTCVAPTRDSTAATRLQ